MDAIMARVNITRQIKTETGWKNVSLLRDGRGRIQWGSGVGRYLIEWYEEGRRRRLSAGSTPSEALEAQRQKRLELDARDANVKLPSRIDEDDDAFRLDSCLSAFLKDIEAFRKSATHDRYKFILELFFDHVAPKK